MARRDKSHAKRDVMVDSTQSTEETLAVAQGSDKPSKKVKSSSAGGPPRKRGPPRPHRKLAQEVLEGRIGKLRKRIERSRNQLEDAERHIEGYIKESSYRDDEKKA